MVYKCNLCSFDEGFKTDSVTRLLNHIGRCHRADPDFHIVCGIEDCTRTFRNYNAYRKHVRKKHSAILEAPNRVENIENNELENEDLSEPFEEPEIDVECQNGQIKRNNALSLMKIKEVGKLTQQSLDVVVDQTTQVVRNTVDVLKRDTVACLQAIGVDSETVPGLEELFDRDVVSDPFKDLENRTQQLQYFRENFNLVVSNLI